MSCSARAVLSTIGIVPCNGEYCKDRGAVDLFLEAKATDIVSRPDKAEIVYLS
jgi:hypothetical protein